MKIRIDLEGTAIVATLVDNETSKDFVALLPLTLTLEDHEEDYQGVIDLKQQDEAKGGLDAASKSSTERSTRDACAGSGWRQRERAVSERVA